MAAKSILKDTKAPLHLLRMAALSAARPKPAACGAAADELARALRAASAAAPPAPLAETSVLRRSLCDLGDGRLWALNSDLLHLQARGGSKSVVDEDSDDDDFDDADDDFDDDDDDADDAFDSDVDDDDEDFDVRKRK